MALTQRRSEEKLAKPEKIKTPDEEFQAELNAMEAWLRDKANIDSYRLVESVRRKDILKLTNIIYGSYNGLDLSEDVSRNIEAMLAAYDKKTDDKDKADVLAKHSLLPPIKLIESQYRPVLPVLPHRFLAAEIQIDHYLNCDIKTGMFNKGKGGHSSLKTKLNEARADWEKVFAECGKMYVAILAGHIEHTDAVRDEPFKYLEMLGACFTDEKIYKGESYTKRFGKTTTASYLIFFAESQEAIATLIKQRGEKAGVCVGMPFTLQRDEKGDCVPVLEKYNTMHAWLVQTGSVTYTCNFKRSKQGDFVTVSDERVAKMRPGSH